MATARLVAFVEKKTNGDLATGQSGKSIFDYPQVAGYQREEITGFDERVVPLHLVAAIVECACFRFVAVRQEDRILLVGRFDRRRINAHHIRAIREISDMPEAFRFILGTKDVAGLVQAFECGVFVRLDFCLVYTSDAADDLTRGVLLGCGPILTLLTTHQMFNPV